MEFYTKFKSRMATDSLYRLSVTSVVMQALAVASLFLALLLSSTLMQLMGKIKIDTLLVSNTNHSEKIAIVEPFDEGMQNIDFMTETMIRYYIDMAFSVNASPTEVVRRIGYRGELYYLSVPKVWAKVYDSIAPALQRKGGLQINYTTIAYITSVKKLASNLWQAEFDQRVFNMETETLTIRNMKVSMRVRYYRFRSRIAPTLKNPLGFTITELNFSRVQDS